MTVEFDYNEAELRSLEEALEAVDQLVASRVRGDGCAAMARVAAKAARQYVPVKTGALKRSIRVRRTTDRSRGVKLRNAAANLFAGGKGARHAHLIELGTVRAAAIPYLAPAITKTGTEQHRAFVDACRVSFEKNVRALARGTASAAFVRSVTA